MTYDQLNEVWLHSGAAGWPSPSSWYYKGSDDHRHYFARATLRYSFSERYRTYKVEKSAIVVRGAFPLTQVKSEWRGIYVHLMSLRTPGDDHFPKTLDFTEQRRGIEVDVPSLRAFDVETLDVTTQ
ncbi:MAG: hypothetical protein ACYS9X_13105 [Planctomycetota bacterium]|jgi:hypothetical protein